MKITCDDREDGDVLEMVRDIFKWNSKDFEIKRLKIGDYVNDDLGIVIERKTIDDFCLSIMDGRLKKQVENMLENYKYCFVLVSGRISDRKTEIHENSILGMMTSIVMKGVNVICVDDDRQLCYIMKRLFERFEDIELEGGEKHEDTNDKVK